MACNTSLGVSLFLRHGGTIARNNGKIEFIVGWVRETTSIYGLTARSIPFLMPNFVKHLCHVVLSVFCPPTELLWSTVHTTKRDQETEDESLQRHRYQRSSYITSATRGVRRGSQGFVRSFGGAFPLRKNCGQDQQVSARWPPCFDDGNKAQRRPCSL